MTFLYISVSFPGRGVFLEKHEVAQKRQSKNPDFWKKELTTIKINQLKNSGSNII
jgi:hypothetical protein